MILMPHKPVHVIYVGTKLSRGLQIIESTRKSYKLLQQVQDIEDII